MRKRDREREVKDLVRKIESREEKERMRIRTRIRETERNHQT